MKNAKLKWFTSKILEKELDLDNFDEKLTVQKAVYIAQKMGIEFNYGFGWYVRGVYSSSLTVDLYEIHDVVISYSPSEVDNMIVNNLLSIKNSIGTIYQTFEIISSVVYAKFDRHMDEEGIIKFIKSVMPWFSDDDITKSISGVNILIQKL